MTEGNLQLLWDASVSRNTHKAYQAGINAFLLFMTTCGLARDNLHQALSEHVLLMFVAYCAKTLRLRYATIKLYLSAVRFMYLRKGVASPWTTGDTVRLQTVVKAVKREQTPVTSVRQPITNTVLYDMCRALTSEVFPHDVSVLMKAASCLAFFGFLRCGEFTCDFFHPDFNLCMSSVIFHADLSQFTLLLKSSKTDPFREGVQLRFFKNGLTICPVASMLTYCLWRRSSSPREMDPLFISPDGKALTRRYFIAKMRLLLQAAGYDQTIFNGHSFRIGAATSAAAEKIPDHMIQRLGRWTSQCYTRYIRTPETAIENALRVLSGATEGGGC